MILKPIPVADRPMMQLKVFAADALKGRRKEWGFDRKWEGNYLLNVCTARVLCTSYHAYCNTPIRSGTNFSFEIG